VTVWTEVADGVFRQRYEPLDIGICVVRGSAGLLLVDTRSSHREAAQVRTDLAELAGGVRWVVNTHAHYDHTFGNALFGPASDLAAPIYGHELVPAHLDRFERALLADWVANDEERRAEWAEVEITPPDVLVGDHASIDLGDRVVELSHLGRGHTDNDLVLHLPDARVWLAGDLVEESGPPCYGSGSFPLDWPATIQALLGLVGAGDLVVPGHGAVVDPSFVARQQVELTETADLIRELYDAGIPVDQAAAAGGDRWPFPVDGMPAAVRDGYAQLGGVTWARSG
jgi:glyoxylase-like metal-dependent hydrolase (beta-lactamase superfamily II)